MEASALRDSIERDVMERDVMERDVMTWLPALAGRLREAFQGLTTATVFRLKPEATPWAQG